MCLELFKLVQGHQQISSFRNSFLNLATSYYFLSQPLKDPGFTVSTAAAYKDAWPNMFICDLSCLVGFVKEK